MLSEYDVELMRATLDERQRELTADLAAEAAVAATVRRPSLIQRLLSHFSSDPHQQARLRSQLAQ